MPKFWSRIAHFPVCIIKEFPVFDPFVLTFAVISPWKLGHSPNINYSFGIFVRLSVLQVSLLYLRFYFFGRLQELFNETKHLKLLFLNFGGDMPPDPPKRAYCSLKKFLATPLSKSSHKPCCQKPALKEYLAAKKCLRLVKYKQLQKKKKFGLGQDQNT